MYQGRHPQDSHEVFRTILDSIRNEECGVSNNAKTPKRPTISPNHLMKLDV